MRKLLKIRFLQAIYLCIQHTIQHCCLRIPSFTHDVQERLQSEDCLRAILINKNLAQ